MGLLDEISSNDLEEVCRKLDESNGDPAFLEQVVKIPIYCKCLFKINSNWTLPSQRNGEGDSGLHIACYLGFLDMVMLLVDYGADLDSKNTKVKIKTSF